MINELYSPKQQEVLNFAFNTDFFMLINHGAKRSGKTVVDNDLFLFELRRVRKIADKLHIPLPQYILAGADLGSLQRNVLIEITNKYDIELKLDKHNRMTAFGAYINEGTMANKEVMYEIKSRCSGEGARIIMDTNSDSPEHYIKKDFIDTADGKIIKEVHWELTDNTFLSQRYIDNIIATTPSGVFTDRDIHGYWVTPEGIVYSDFNEKIHYIDSIEGINFVKYIAGVDWGYSHFGAIVVIGIDDKGNYYLIEESAEQFKEIDFWVKEAKKIKEKYGNIPFYCETARPEYNERFKREHIKAIDADKAVLSGIEAVATLYKSKRLYILRTAVKRFKDEIYMYVWKDKTDEPIKLFDDVQDAIRYAIYTSQNKKQIQFGYTRPV